MAKRKARKQVPAETATEKVSPATPVIPCNTGLKGRKLEFARQYLRDRSATAAYIRAGYKASPNAGAHASRLLADPGVQAFISQAEARATMEAIASVARLEMELQRIALVDVRKLYLPDGSLKPPAEWDDDTAAAVGSIEVKEEFEGVGDARKQTGWTKKVKVIDKCRALVALLQRRDDAAKAPAAGSSAEAPLHVSLTLTQRLAQLDAAFEDAADRACQAPIPPDGRRESVDTGADKGRADSQAGSVPVL